MCYGGDRIGFSLGGRLGMDTPIKEELFSVHGDYAPANDPTLSHKRNLFAHDGITESIEACLLQCLGAFCAGFFRFFVLR